MSTTSRARTGGARASVRAKLVPRGAPPDSFAASLQRFSLRAQEEVGNVASDLVVRGNDFLASTQVLPHLESALGVIVGTFLSADEEEATRMLGATEGTAARLTSGADGRESLNSGNAHLHSWEVIRRFLPTSLDLLVLVFSLFCLNVAYMIFSDFPVLLDFLWLCMHASLWGVSWGLCAFFRGFDLFTVYSHWQAGEGDVELHQSILLRILGVVNALACVFFVTLTIVRSWRLRQARATSALENARVRALSADVKDSVSQGSAVVSSAFSGSASEGEEGFDKTSPPVKSKSEEGAITGASGVSHTESAPADARLMASRASEDFSTESLAEGAVAATVATTAPHHSKMLGHGSQESAKPISREASKDDVATSAGGSTRPSGSSSSSLLNWTSDEGGLLAVHKTSDNSDQDESQNRLKATGLPGALPKTVEHEKESSKTTSKSSAEEDSDQRRVTASKASTRATRRDLHLDEDEESESDDSNNEATSTDKIGEQSSSSSSTGDQETKKNSDMKNNEVDDVLDGQHAPSGSSSSKAQSFLGRGIGKGPIENNDHEANKYYRDDTNTPSNSSSSGANRSKMKGSGRGRVVASSSSSSSSSSSASASEDDGAVSSTSMASPLASPVPSPKTSVTLTSPKSLLGDHSNINYLRGNRSNKSSMMFARINERPVVYSLPLQQRLQREREAEERRRNGLGRRLLWSAYYALALGPLLVLCFSSKILDAPLEEAFLTTFGEEHHKFSGKTVLVSDATSGIGFHTAKWLSEWGRAKVVYLGARGRKACDRVKSEIMRPDFTRLKCFLFDPFDARVDEQKQNGETVFRRIDGALKRDDFQEEADGPVDVLINTAGFLHYPVGGVVRSTGLLPSNENHTVAGGENGNEVTSLPATFSSAALMSPTLRAHLKPFAENYKPRGPLDNLLPRSTLGGSDTKEHISRQVGRALKDAEVLARLNSKEAHDERPSYLRTFTAQRYLHTRLLQRYPGIRVVTLASSASALCRTLGVSNDETHYPETGDDWERLFSTFFFYQFSQAFAPAMWSDLSSAARIFGKLELILEEFVPQSRLFDKVWPLSLLDWRRSVWVALSAGLGYIAPGKVLLSGLGPEAEELAAEVNRRNRLRDNPYLQDHAADARRGPGKVFEILTREHSNSIPPFKQKTKTPSSSTAEAAPFSDETVMLRVKKAAICNAGPYAHDIALFDYIRAAFWQHLGVISPRETLVQGHFVAASLPHEEEYFSDFLDYFSPTTSSLVGGLQHISDEKDLGFVYSVVEAVQGFFSLILRRVREQFVREGRIGAIPLIKAALSSMLQSRNVEDEVKSVLSSSGIPCFSSQGDKTTCLPHSSHLTVHKEHLRDTERNLIPQQTHS
ncbi:unnamed protein product [Amoebophrya sp. A25]|nr:unnamed protein product [Amoebophrya sp. A25]|eukprot:GSA25T00016680001.1